MAKKRKKSNPTKSRGRTPVQKPAQNAPLPPQSRRHFLGNAALVSTVGAIVIAGGMALARDFGQGLQESDLTKVGNGLPTIVQIHDPGCSLCRALQKETRAALETYSEDEVQYLVANVKSQDGAAFANQMGQPHVTLIFFDGAGAQQHVISGVTPRATIAAAIHRHLRPSRGGTS